MERERIETKDTPTEGPRRTTNRQNALVSTGPRTVEGKARSSRNATLHGILSKLPVLDDECPADWRRHRSMVLDDLDPVGAVETLLAERIACLFWRLRRVARYEWAAADVARDLATRARLLNGGLMSLTDEQIRDLTVLPDNRRLQKLQRYEAHLERSLMRNSNLLRKLQTERGSKHAQSFVVEVLQGDSELFPNEPKGRVLTNGS